MASTNQDFSPWVAIPISCTAGRESCMPFLAQVNDATIAERAAESAPHSAATLPPPGAGESADSSSANSSSVIAFSPVGAPR